MDMKPISMKCSKEQFEEIKPILEENGLEIYDLNLFNKFPYLVNNSVGNFGTISIISNGNKSFHNRTVFEEWDKDLFLKYCDIKPISKKIDMKPISKNDGNVIFTTKSLPIIVSKINNFSSISSK